MMTRLFIFLILLLGGCGKPGTFQKITNGKINPNRQLSVALAKSDSLVLPNKTEFEDSANIRIVRRWELDYYEPAGNKIIGFWPECCGNEKFAFLKEYRRKWGFNAIVITASEKSIKMALRSGFELPNILTTVHQFKSVKKIKAVVEKINSYLYYIDEPLERGTFSTEELIDIANYIRKVRPSAKLILGSYQKTWWFYKFFPPETYGSAYNEVLRNTTNVQIMCDNYSGNQLSDWESFYDTYGADKIFGHFIHSKIDSTEYSALLDTTNFKSKTKRIILFHGANGSPMKTPEFCEAAWQKGWLRKFEREIVYYLKCINEKMDCTQPNARWEIVKTIKTNNLKEVYPGKSKYR